MLRDHRLRLGWSIEELEEARAQSDARGVEEARAQAEAREQEEGEQLKQLPCSGTGDAGAHGAADATEADFQRPDASDGHTEGACSSSGADVASVAPQAAMAGDTGGEAARGAGSPVFALLRSRRTISFRETLTTLQVPYDQEAVGGGGGGGGGGGLPTPSTLPSTPSPPPSCLSPLASRIRGLWPDAPAAVRKLLDNAAAAPVSPPPSDESGKPFQGDDYDEGNSRSVPQYRGGSGGGALSQRQPSISAGSSRSRGGGSSGGSHPASEPSLLQRHQLAQHSISAGGSGSRPPSPLGGGGGRSGGGAGGSRPPSPLGLHRASSREHQQGDGDDGSARWPDDNDAAGPPLDASLQLGLPLSPTKPFLRSASLLTKFDVEGEAALKPLRAKSPSALDLRRQSSAGLLRSPSSTHSAGLLRSPSSTHLAGLLRSPSSAHYSAGTAAPSSSIGLPRSPSMQSAGAAIRPPSPVSLQTNSATSPDYAATTSLSSPTRRGSVTFPHQLLPGSPGRKASARQTGRRSSWVCEASSTERRLLRGALEDRSLGLPPGVMAVLGGTQGDQVGGCGSGPDHG